MIENKNQKNMKKAYIDQILMMMVVFIGFYWSFMFVTQYAAVLRTHESMDDMSKYGARFVSNYSPQDAVSADQNLADGLNNLNIPKIPDVAVSDIACVIATSGPALTNSQSVFITQGTYTTGYFKGKALESKVVVYNQRAQAQITCTLSVTIN